MGNAEIKSTIPLINQGACKTQRVFPSPRMNPGTCIQLIFFGQ